MIPHLFDSDQYHLFLEAMCDKYTQNTIAINVQDIVHAELHEKCMINVNTPNFIISYCKWCCQINLKNDLKHFHFH